MTTDQTDGTMALHLVMPSKNRGTKGRRPGRPRSSENAEAAHGDKPVLNVILTPDIWNRLNKALEKARADTGFVNLSKADLVRSLLDKALPPDEPAKPTK